MHCREAAQHNLVNKITSLVREGTTQLYTSKNTNFPPEANARQGNNTEKRKKKPTPMQNIGGGGRVMMQLPSSLLLSFSAPSSCHQHHLAFPPHKQWLMVAGWSAVVVVAIIVLIVLLPWWLSVGCVCAGSSLSVVVVIFIVVIIILPAPSPHHPCPHCSPCCTSLSDIPAVLPTSSCSWQRGLVHCHPSLIASHPHPTSSCLQQWLGVLLLWWWGILGHPCHLVLLHHCSPHPGAGCCCVFHCPVILVLIVLLSSGMLLSFHCHTILICWLTPSFLSHFSLFPPTSNC